MRRSGISIHIKGNAQKFVSMRCYIEGRTIEAPDTVGVVERYRDPLRAGYSKIRKYKERTVSDAKYLRM